MNEQERIETLESALRANVAIIHEAQHMLAEYLQPDSWMDANTAINRLAALLDGPKQRHAQELAMKALAIEG